MPDAPLIVIVGNEVTGVDPGLLQLCERQIAIPMYGMKKSLNVATAFGVAAYWLTYLRIAERHR
jgi:tRNA G18 (ribose-2'-O)-methylase SpoU